MCDDFSVLLSAYVDDEVTASERTRVETHLAGCPHCRAELKLLQQTTHFAGMLPEILPPSGLRRQILERTVYRRSAWQRLRDTVTRPSVWRPALVVAGAAGILVYSLNAGSPVPQVATAPSPRPQPKMQVKPPPPIQTEATVAALPKPPKKSMKDELKGLMQRVHDVIAPMREDAAVATAPQETPRGGLKKLSPSPTATSVEKAADKIALVSVKPKSTPVKPTLKPKPNRSGVPAVKNTRTLPKASPDTITEPPAEGSFTPMGDHPMLATAPSSHDTERPAKADDAGPEAEPKREIDTDNPIVAGLTAMASNKAARPDPTKEMVQKMNATLNASALSSARQVKWDIGKIKF